MSKKTERKQPEVPCPHCNGRGTVVLSGVHADTLALVRKQPGLNGAQLAAIAKCKATAMNNRLQYLRKFGLVGCDEYGREKLWAVVQNAEVKKQKKRSVLIFEGERYEFE